MRLVYFAHSLRSCWNHGNAHFLRGVLRELLARGHEVRAFEPVEGWSLQNMRREPAGLEALSQFEACFPELSPHIYNTSPDVDRMLDGADVVVMHEWNDPGLVAAVGARRRGGGRFRLFFHDTHHRAITDPDALQAFDLRGYDGILAFGETLAAIYRNSGWGSRAFVWHEAADTRLFMPVESKAEREGAVWVGNWGDDERSEELRSYLLRPTNKLGMRLDIYGVRYPMNALEDVAASGAVYHGWLPNVRAPEIFARHQVTVHVPRRAYTEQLIGIPTIRVFEALACGIPLVCAPWNDAESLFRPGIDYLLVANPDQMLTHLRQLRDDPDLRADLAKNGLETIRRRHTCSHRVEELLSIIARCGREHEA